MIHRLHRGRDDGELTEQLGRKGGGDQCGGFAYAFGDTYRTESVRLYIAQCQVDVVAILVQLHLLVLVVGRAVDFHHHPVFVVPVVAVLDLATELATRLMFRPGQPMCSLYVPKVTSLQRRVDSVLRILKCILQPLPPADPRPVGKGRTERLDCYALFEHRAGNTGVGVVEGWRGGDQVEDGVLDPGSRQLERA